MQVSAQLVKMDIDQTPYNYEKEWYVINAYTHTKYWTLYSLGVTGLSTWKSKSLEMLRQSIPNASSCMLNNFDLSIVELVRPQFPW